VRVNVLANLLTGVESITDRHVNVQQDYVEVARVVLLFHFLESYESIVSSVYFKVVSEL